MNDPFAIVKSRHITEKATALSNLQSNESNPSVRRCESPKYVFIVDKKANKIQIAQAVEEIHKERNIKVVAVNTINAKPKAKRKGRGRPGQTASFKKAIVTLEKGDSLDNV